MHISRHSQDGGQVVTVYPSRFGEQVYSSFRLSAGAFRRLDVLAWAVLEDHTVVPIADWLGLARQVLDRRWLWAEDLNELTDLWHESLPQLPGQPNGTAIPSVPVYWFGEDLIFGSVGLGNDIWGPYRLDGSLVVAHGDIARHDQDLIIDDVGTGVLWLREPATYCRVTWDRSGWVETESAPTVIVDVE